RERVRQRREPRGCAVSLCSLKWQYKISLYTTRFLTCCRTECSEWTELRDPGRVAAEVSVKRERSPDHTAVGRSSLPAFAAMRPLAHVLAGWGIRSTEIGAGQRRSLA